MPREAQLPVANRGNILRFRKRFAANMFGERLTGNVFHYQNIHAIDGFKAMNHTDVRMIETRQG